MADEITNRTALIESLAEAAQLEHAICCQYLYAAFSLKKGPGEGLGEAAAVVREWAATLFLIARQEMEHLGIVANLLTSIGAAPDFRRPNFPLSSQSYGELPALELLPFGHKAIETWLVLESPVEVLLRKILLQKLVCLKKEGTLTFGAAISCVLDEICAETGWAYGEVWLSNAADRTFHRLDVKYGSHRSPWHQGGRDGRAFWSRTEKGKLVPTTRSMKGKGSQANLNTQTQIPLFLKNQCVAVFRFAYQTFSDRFEDQKQVQTTDLTLNGPDENSPHQPNTLNQFLAELYEESSSAAHVHGWHTVFQAAARPLDFDWNRFHYRTLGGFYTQIRRGFLRLHASADPTGKKGDLFLGAKKVQIDNIDIGLAVRGAHDMTMVPVSDIESAVQAIDAIIEEGEGAGGETITSHYGRLKNLKASFHEVLRKNPEFNPTRKVVANPISHPRRSPPNRGTPTSQLITHPTTRTMAQIFNASYALMLLMLTRYFSHPEERALADVIFAPFMTMAIRPMGEILTSMLAGESGDSLAGPTFEGGEGVFLHPHRSPAWEYFRERLQEIATRLGSLGQALDPEHRKMDLEDRLNLIQHDLGILANKIGVALQSTD